jgi:class 3 adenylate cyclase
MSSAERAGASARLAAVELTREVPGPAALVWALACDTNRLDRVLGAGRAEYAREVSPEGSLRVGRGSTSGADLRWTEHGEWIEGDLLFAERRFLEGLFERATLRVEVRSADARDAGEPRSRVWLSASMLLSAPIADEALEALRLKLGAALIAYVDGLDELFARAPITPSSAPAGVAARRLVAASTWAAPIVTGPRTAVDEHHFAFCAARFSAAPVAAELRASLLELLRLAPDSELVQMRPFELAPVLGAAPTRGARGLLACGPRGARDARLGARLPELPGGVGERAHARVAQADRALLRLRRHLRLRSGRQRRGGVSGEPGAARARPAPLLRGLAVVEASRLRARRARRRGAARAQVPRRRGPCSCAARALGRWREPRLALGLRVVVGAAGVRVEAAAEGQLALENHTSRELVLSLEHLSTGLARVTGVDVLTLPELGDLFGGEAPATGVELSIGQLTLLFTDLTDSTALYERLGDARAFALVEQHFRRASELVAAHGGAVVKTMGDAVMAAFASPEAALRAALALTRETRESGGHEALSLRAGLHAGPCLAVRANERLDYFGTTVNLAARLQAHAKADEIAILEELLAHAGVAALVKGEGLAHERHEAALKGLREARRVVVFDAR